ncbi:MAG: DUF4256 domain-containing protein [Raoultibacter sp.]
MKANKELDTAQRTALLEILQERFEVNAHRHEGVDWLQVQAALESHPQKLWSVSEMERTGGEPDVVAGVAFGGLAWVDCSPETPAGRRNLCFDNAALEARKKNKPLGSALGMAQDMGVELLTEDQYRALQELDAFDLKTSSWVATPEAVRKHGGALFCDRRFNHVFTYHNGAESYYAARGFRALLSLCVA